MSSENGAIINTTPFSTHGVIMRRSAGHSRPRIFTYRGDGVWIEKSGNVVFLKIVDDDTLTLHRGTVDAKPTLIFTRNDELAYMIASSAELQTECAKAIYSNS
jgi:hypothetical protein